VERVHGLSWLQQTFFEAVLQTKNDCGRSHHPLNGAGETFEVRDHVQAKRGKVMTNAIHASKYLSSRL
jgi:hypothetical protein